MEATLPPPKAEIGILLYPGCQLAMVHGMTDLLTVAGQFSARQGGPLLRVSHWQRREAGDFARSVDTHAAHDAADGPSVLLIPGRLAGPMAPEDAAPYANWLRERHAEGTMLAASCIGSFLLAATGLLDGRMATTHWQHAGAFRTLYPRVRLDPDRILIEDGDLITSGAFMAWVDLGLLLVERQLGPAVMLETGQCLLADPAGREQRHYARFAPRLDHGDEAILKVQHWLQAREARAVSVADMARAGTLEERTFLRRFKAATGLKPIEYLQQLRVGKARELLEFTRRPVEQIAWSVGYEDAAAFRKLFHRIVGLSPGDYRARFAVAGPRREAA